MIIFQKKSVGEKIKTFRKRFKKNEDAMKYLKFILWKSFNMKPEMSDEDAIRFSDTFKKYKENPNTEGVWID